MARILVVDDVSAVREFVRRALALKGHEVVGAGSGLEGLEMLPVRDPFDLVLTDIAMPGLDGIALAREVARRHPGTRILLMTGHPVERRRAELVEAYVDGVIMKPFTLEQLCSLVQRALEGELHSALRRA